MRNRSWIRLLERVSQMGFLVSLTSYGFFWMLDAYQPGFVSRYLSVHVFLLAAIVFGVVWATVVHEYVERRILHAFLGIGLGVLAAVIMWKTTQDLESYRVVAMFLGFIAPLTLIHLLHSYD